MEIVTPLVLFIPLFLAAVSRIKTRFHKLSDGLTYVTGVLDKTEGNTRAHVGVPQAHPLSEEQIKDIAQARGFVLIKIDNGGGATRLMHFARESEQTSDA